MRLTSLIPASVLLAASLSARADVITLAPGGSVQVGNNTVVCSGNGSDDYVLDAYCYCTGPNTGCSQREIVKRYIYQSGRDISKTLYTVGSPVCASMDDCLATMRTLRVCATR